MDPNHEISVPAPALVKPDFLSRLFAPKPARATPSFPHLRIITPPVLTPVICNLTFKIYSEASVPTTSPQPLRRLPRFLPLCYSNLCKLPAETWKGPVARRSLLPRASSQLAFRPLAVLPQGLCHCPFLCLQWCPPGLAPELTWAPGATRVSFLS